MEFVYNLVTGTPRTSRESPCPYHSHQCRSENICVLLALLELRRLIMGSATAPVSFVVFIVPVANQECMLRVEMWQYRTGSNN